MSDVLQQKAVTALLTCILNFSRDPEWSQKGERHRELEPDTDAQLEITARFCLLICLQADVSLFCPAPLPGSKVSTISGTKHEEKALLRGKVHKCGLDARLIQLEAPVSSEHGRAHSHLIQKALKTYPRIPILYIFPWNCCILVTIYFPYKNILPSMFFFPNFCRKNNRSGYNYTLMLASLQALC